MSFSQKTEQSFVLRLREQAIEHAQEFGRSEITQTDIIHALCNVSETRDIFKRKGIDFGRLDRDVNVIQLYGWETLFAAIDPTEDANYQELIQSEAARLKQTLFASQDFTQTLVVIKANYPTTYESILHRLVLDLSKIVIDLDVDQMPPERITARKVLMELIVKKIALFSLNPEELETTLTTLSHALQVTRVSDQNSSEHFFETLGKIEANSPASLVERAFQVLDAKHKYLLYRNGMIAPEGYTAPARLPNDDFLELLGNTHELAHERRDSETSLNHLFLTLLNNHRVAAILSTPKKQRPKKPKTNVAKTPDDFWGFLRSSLENNSNQDDKLDLNEFTKQVTRALFGKIDEQEKFRHYPTVHSELGVLIQNILFGETDLSPNPRISVKQIALDIKDNKLAALFKNSLLQDNDLYSSVLFLSMMNHPAIAKQCKRIHRWQEIKTAYEKNLIESCRQAAAKGRSRKASKTTKIKTKAEKTPFKVTDIELEELLGEYATDLIKRSKSGRADPVIGRQAEMNSLVKILMRRNRANPIIIGPPGVGKSALFDALAQRIASGSVPKELIGSQLYLLDMGKMTAGTQYRGQFEARLAPIINGIEERNAAGDKPLIILCLDEAHAGLQAGSASNSPGASEQLKPFLGSRFSRLVATTTQDEYTRHIAKDPALARRFTPVFVDEPPVIEAQQIVGGVRPGLVTHHGVEIPSAVSDRVVKLAIRYLPERYNPDKSIEVLDEACVEARLAGATTLSEAHALNVIARMAKLPPEFLHTNDTQRYLTLENTLQQEVFGQPLAAKALAHAFMRGAVHMNEDNKPFGAYVFIGPTGVGKTEMARVAAKHLLGTTAALTRLDMSNYTEQHTISRLVGAPPGYVGYAEEGTLTGPVRNRPYSVVLLDEFDKAHRDIFKVLMPVYEEGVTQDMAGRRADFRNTVLIQSLNLDAHHVFEQYADPANLSESEQEEITQKFLVKLGDKYPPEFLNRLDGVIVFNPLKEDTLSQIVQRELGKVKERALQEHGIKLGFDDSVVRALAQQGYDVQYGARPMKRIINNDIIVPLSRTILEHKSEEKPLRRVGFTYGNGGYQLSVHKAA